MKKPVSLPVPDTDVALPGKSKSKEERQEHIGSSRAFEETENPRSDENDNLSDERIDEILEK